MMVSFRESQSLRIWICRPRRFALLWCHSQKLYPVLMVCAFCRLETDLVSEIAPGNYSHPCCTASEGRWPLGAFSFSYKFITV